MFPISRDPPEGGKIVFWKTSRVGQSCFQFLGIPPKGEQSSGYPTISSSRSFPISRDPPEGGTPNLLDLSSREVEQFPISRDPPEGGTWEVRLT